MSRLRPSFPSSFFRLPSMRLPALAACCLTILSGLALAQEPTLPATVPAAPAAADTAAAPVPAATPTLGVQERSATLKQLGMDYEVTLRGIQGSAGVAFSTRTDEVVEAAIPPAEEMDALLQLVRMGNMQAIAARADYLEKLDPAFTPFARRVRTLAQAYQSKALAAFVARYHAAPRPAQQAEPPVAPASG